MRVTRVTMGALLSVLFLASHTAFGAGFGLYEGSAKGNVLGGMTSSPNDAAAMYYNPAAMTSLEGTHFMGGLTLISPFADLKTHNTYDATSEFVDASMADQVFTPPHIYFTHQLNEKIWLGAGVYSRFGLGTKYDEDWDGRYSNINTQIASVSFAGNIAYKVNDKVSLGFGLSAMYFTASIESAIDATQFMLEPHNNPNTNTFDAVQTIEGSAVGLGWNLSAHIEPNDKWSFGIFYNSEVEQKLEDGTAEFHKPDGLPDTWFVDTNLDLEPIDLPSMLFLAASFHATEKTSWHFGAVQTGWGSIEKLVFNYKNPFVVIPSLGLSVDQVVSELHWEDTWRYNLGFEYRKSDHFHLYLGAIVDETPIPDSTVSFLLPSNDRQLINVGFRKVLGTWTIDGGLDWLVIQNRDIAERQLEDGVLDASVRNGAAILLGFTMSRKF